MLGKRINDSVSKIIKYKFNINDPVFYTGKNDIKNATILSRFTIKYEIYYKIGNSVNKKMCKETELIHR